MIFRARRVRADRFAGLCQTRAFFTKGHVALIGVLALSAAAAWSGHIDFSVLDGSSASAKLMEPGVPRRILVSDAPSLQRALKTAKGGERILLAPGMYERVVILNFRPDRPVSIEATGNAAAQIGSLKIENSAHLRVTGLNIGRGLRAGESDSVQYAAVFGSEDIIFAAVSFHGSLDDDVSNDGRGVRVSGGSDIAIIGSNFKQLRVAAAFFDVDRIIFAYNDVKQSREGLDIAGGDQILIENNRFSEMGRVAGEHTDAIQFFTRNASRGASNARIRNNGFLFGDVTSYRTQGLFISSQVKELRHRNIVVENNAYYGSAVHGIGINNADDVIVRNNAIFTFPNNANKNGGEIIASLSMNDVRNATIRSNVTSNLSMRECLCAVEQNVVVHSAKNRNGIAITKLLKDGSKGIRGTEPRDFEVKSPKKGGSVGFHPGEESWGKWQGSIDELLARYGRYSRG